MNCHTAQELIIDAATGSVSEATRHELMQHLQTCAECAALAQEYEQLWSHLDYAVPPTFSAAGSDRILGALRSEIAKSKSSPTRLGVRRWGPQVLIRLAASIALVLIGTAIGTRLPERSDPVSIADANRFLLLMENVNVPPEDQMTFSQDFGSWINRLQGAGTMLTGSAFGPSATVASLPSQGGTGTGIMGGFMIVQARDMAEARRIAEEAPTRRHGGSVEIRAISEQ